MRLIHTTRLEFKEFFNIEQIKYAVLSHCWGKAEDEVTYQQFLAGEARDTEGWRKISLCCSLAKATDLEWAWIDTCCIDKTSTAELSEAINSMYDWYRQSTECYVVLPEIIQKSGGDASERIPMAKDLVANSHLSSQPPRGNRREKSRDRKKTEKLSYFGHSRWFKRGWTLQELLAPRSIHFYDRAGSFIGTKSSLSRHLALINGIKTEYLEGTRSIHEASVACRMSWASARETTRGEDIAYCLLGIFEINMPLLYGEGSKGAFRRLQEAIIGQSDDQTIFAWTRQTDATPRSSILAQSPSDFADGLFLVPKRHDAPPSRITSRGVEVFMTKEWLRDLFGGHLQTSPSMRVYSPIMHLPLACYDLRWAATESQPHDSVEIMLKRDEVAFVGVEQYYRIDIDRRLRTSIPALVEGLRLLTNSVMVPRYRSIYAQRLDRPRDDHQRHTPRSEHKAIYDSYPPWDLPSHYNKPWTLALFWATLSISKLGHWLGQLDNGTLWSCAILALLLYYNRDNLTYLVFFAHSGLALDKRVWIESLTGFMLILNAVDPSWLTAILPHGTLRYCMLIVPHLIVNSWLAAMPEGRVHVLGVAFQLVSQTVFTVAWVLLGVGVSYIYGYARMGLTLLLDLASSGLLEGALCYLSGSPKVCLTIAAIVASLIYRYSAHRQ